MKINDQYIKDLDEITARTGGPAFPTKIDGLGEAGIPTVKFNGMTLRDWFAGQAITGALANGDDFEFAEWDNCAKYAYALADAMLAERNKKEGEADE
jgi:hypothetical protein